MKSNGFGSWIQEIVVHVDKEHAEQIASELGVAPFKEAGDPVRSYFLWSRTSPCAGNDEDIIFDLFRLLGNPADRLGWSVDWDNSQY